MEQKKQNEAFVYTYSAKDNAEIEQIRRKYLPQSESKLEELKRLDKTVQESGVIEALISGVGGLMIFGLGMCLSMQVIADGTLAVIFGVLLSIIGIGAILIAYPLYKRVYNATKEKYTARIIEITDQLSNKQVKEETP